MILVTRLNGTTLYINAEEIQIVEDTPDTVITLLDASKIVVSEGSEKVVDKIIYYRQVCNQEPGNCIVTEGE